MDPKAWQAGLVVKIADRSKIATVFIDAFFKQGRDFTRVSELSVVKSQHFLRAAKRHSSYDNGLAGSAETVIIPPATANHPFLLMALFIAQ